MSNKNTNQLLPKLRFPDFRDAGAWGTRELGEFITERNQFPTGSVSLFSLTIEDGITPKTERYERSFLVNDEVGAYKLVLPDDFAYNPMNLRFGAIGRHSGIENVAVSKYYNIFFCDKTVNSKFCEIYFKSDQMIAFYDNMAIGSLIEKRRVHFSGFLKFNIRFPLLPEQQKIADCLSSLDELITAEAQKLDTLKVHKKGLMQQLFPAEGETVPGMRFPEFRDAGEWEEKKLGQIANLYKGKGISKSDITINGAHPCVRYGELYTIYNEVIDKVTSKTNLSLTGLFLSMKGDVIIPASGETKIDIATAACVMQKDVALGSDLNVIRTKHNGVFLSYYLNGSLRFKIAKVAQGDTVVHLYKAQLELLDLALPEPDEQQKIADCLSSLDELITAEVQKIDTLKAHKKGLMQGLFPSADEVGV